MYCLCFVFFKQKTADDMRISDWSSDVCSSDLGIVWASSTTPTGFVPNEDRGIIFTNVELPAGASLDRTVEVTRELYNKLEQIPGVTEIGRATCRERVWQYVEITAVAVT